MARFRIDDNDAPDYLGTYKSFMNQTFEANSEEAALEALASCAGYESFETMIERAPSEITRETFTVSHA